MPTPLPPTNPAVAELRRKSALRKYNKRMAAVRRLWGVAGVLFLVLAVEVLIALGCSPRFWIAGITVEGGDTLETGRVIRLMAIPRQSNIYRTPLDAMAQRVERDPRVAAATVTRQGWNGLRVQVQERQPACVLPGTQPPVYLDAQGVAFTRPLPPRSRVPVLDGVTLAPSARRLGVQVTHPQVVHALECLAAVGATATAEVPLPVTRVQFQPGGTLRLYVAQTPVLLGMPEAFPTKIWMLKQVILHARARGYGLGGLEYIDTTVTAPDNFNAAYRPRDSEETDAP